MIRHILFWNYTKEVKENHVLLVLKKQRQEDIVKKLF